MMNPVSIGDDYFVFRGFPASIKIAKHNKNLVNIIFHKDTTKKFEDSSDLLTVSCWLNSGNKISIGEIALQCENRFLVVECKRTRNQGKDGRIYENFEVKNITAIPLNVYESEFTKEKIEENKENMQFSDEELNELPF